MKKSILILLGLFLIIALSNKSYTQWQYNGEHIYNTNSGNVGIGITEPLWKLHVNGDIGLQSSLHWNNGRSHLSSDQGGSIELGDGHNTLLGPGGPGTPITPFIDFHYGYSLTQDFNMRIINNNDNLLDFVSNSGPKMTFNAAPSGYYSLSSLRLTNMNSSGNSFEFQSVNGLSAIDFWNFGGQNAIIDFFADYQNHPDYNQFSVKRDDNYGNSCGWGNDESWLAGDRRYLGAQNQGASIHLNQAGSNEYAQPYISFSYGTTGNNNHNDVVLKNTGDKQLDIYTGTDKFGEGGNKVMTIKEDGVYAKKITVQSSWSDFVFKPEFKLTSLEDVEKYIKENGHLEGIPTEQEVKENGVDLGDATSALLQKIEELTLYVIEQNKEIQMLKEENSKVK